MLVKRKPTCESRDCEICILLCYSLSFQNTKQKASVQALLTYLQLNPLLAFSSPRLCGLNPAGILSAQPSSGLPSTAPLLNKNHYWKTNRQGEREKKGNIRTKEGWHVRLWSYPADRRETHGKEEEISKHRKRAELQRLLLFSCSYKPRCSYSLKKTKSSALRKSSKEWESWKESDWSKSVPALSIFSIPPTCELSPRSFDVLLPCGLH